MRDVMRTGDAIPTNFASASIADAAREISRGRIGMTVIITPERQILGIFTDGDLRRAIVGGTDLKAASVADVMTRNPRVMSPDKLTAVAVEMMDSQKINQIPVVDDNGTLIGALNIHDLFQARTL
jgi:arabinose-5-phosphate isomerase